MTDIKFCENNFSQGTDEVMSKLKDEFEDINITSESCLGFCGDCAMGPFALVNNEMIQADSADDLYEAIKDVIA